MVQNPPLEPPGRFSVFQLKNSSTFLDPRHFTLDPRHFTLDPRHFTLDPRPSTLDPRPSTKTYIRFSASVNTKRLLVNIE